MEGLDAATASAIAALVVAIVALIVALAQATQQYFITGQLIRLCDSVVYGPMPGQGRRLWQFSQFRFRVIYSIPQISLDAKLWPSSGDLMKSYAIGRHRLPSLADEYDPDVISLHRFSPRMAYYYINQIPRHVKKWKILNWFRRKGRREPSANSTDDLSERSTYIIPVWERFRQSIPLPGVQRRRRQPSPTSSSADSTYQSRLAISNPPPLHQHLGLPSGVIRRFTRSIDSRQLDPRRKSPTVGEASWVSFCRAIETSCRQSVRIDMVKYDADRCPSDLVTVPMQVSMRDVVIMALMAGMNITSASFRDKSISMQGAVGTLTSSNHTILGPILHFTPRNVEDSSPKVFGIRIRSSNGRINRFWIERTWDSCSVAGRIYNFTGRRTVRRLDERWIRDNGGVESYGLAQYRDPRLHSEAKKTTKRAAHRPGSSGDRSVSNAPVAGHAPSSQVVVLPHTRNQAPERRTQDGDWIIVRPPEVIFEGKPSIVPLYRVSTNVPKTETSTESYGNVQGSGTQESPPTGHSGGEEDSRPLKECDTEVQVVTVSPLPAPPTSPSLRRRTTVEEVPDEEESAIPKSSSKKAGAGFSPLLERIDDEREDEKYERLPTPPDERTRLAKERQGARAKKLQQIQEDRITVDNVVKRGAMSSPYDEAKQMSDQSNGDGRLLLTSYPHYPENHSPDGPGPTAEEEAAHEREKKREMERLERDEARHKRSRERTRAADLQKVDMFWLCQIDVMAGSWATPWEFHLPISAALDGAVIVILEALLGFLDVGSSLCYTDSNYDLQYSFRRTADWASQGKITYPAYGHNAQGGVIATGRYKGVHIPCFKSMIPALELLHSYDWQVNGDLRDQAEDGEEMNVELMRLDAWLSYVGRVPEIADGPHRLLSQAPSFVQLLVEDFELDFQITDRSASDGGLQDIQGLVENVMDLLTDEELTQPEQLYVLVALLRGVKVAQCVLAGSNTKEVQEILFKDVQAHLV